MRVEETKGGNLGRTLRNLRAPLAPLHIFMKGALDTWKRGWDTYSD